MKHALLPWKKGQLGSIYDARGNLVCKVEGEGMPKDFPACDANADLVVSACNGRESLLAMLRRWFCHSRV